MRTIVLNHSHHATTRYLFLPRQASGLLRPGKNHSLDNPIVRAVGWKGTFLDTSDHAAFKRRRFSGKCAGRPLTPGAPLFRANGRAHGPGGTASTGLRCSE